MLRPQSNLRFFFSDEWPSLWRGLSLDQRAVSNAPERFKMCRSILVFKFNLGQMLEASYFSVKTTRTNNLKCLL